MMPTTALSTQISDSERLVESRTKSLNSSLNVAILESGLTVRYDYRDGFALAPAGKKLLYVRYRVSNRAGYAVQYTRTDSGILLRDPSGKFVRHSGSANRLLQPMIPARGTIEDTVWFYVPKAEKVTEVHIRRGTETTAVPIARSLKVSPSTFMDKDGTAHDEVEVTFGENVELGPWSVMLESPEPALNGLSKILSPSTEESAICLPLTVKVLVDSTVHLGRGTILVEALDEDGDVASSRQALFNDGGNAPLEADLRKGKSIRGNLLVLARKEMKVAFFRITDPSSGRSIRYRVSNASVLR